MTYDDLLVEADTQGLIVREKDIPGYNGRIYKNRVAINKDIPTSTTKACILAEELGHHYTTVGNILNQDDAMNRKQEQQARLWAYDKLIGLMGIVNSYKAGCRNQHEMAEYLEVDEQFLVAALERYTSKYGTYTTIDNYMISFEPLGVLELNL